MKEKLEQTNQIAYQVLSMLFMESDVSVLFVSTQFQNKIKLLFLAPGSPITDLNIYRQFIL